MVLFDGTEATEHRRLLKKQEKMLPIMEYRFFRLFYSISQLNLAMKYLHIRLEELLSERGLDNGDQ